MKRVVSLLLVLVMLFSLCACDEEAEVKQSSAQTPDTSYSASSSDNLDKPSASVDRVVGDRVPVDIDGVDSSEVTGDPSPEPLMEPDVRDKVTSNPVEGSTDISVVDVTPEVISPVTPTSPPVATSEPSDPVIKATWNLGPVPFEEVYNDGMLPDDNIKMVMSAGYDDNIMDIIVSTKGDKAIVRIDTTVRGEKLSTSMFSRDGVAYLYCTGSLDGESGDILWKLTQSEDADDLAEDIGITKSGFDPESVVSCEYLGVIDGYDTFKLTTEDDQDIFYLKDPETGRIVGFNVGSNDVQAYSVIRFYEAVDSDFIVDIDLSSAEEGDPMEAALVLIAQILSVVMPEDSFDSGDYDFDINFQDSLSA